MVDWHLKEIAAAFERQGWGCIAEHSDDHPKSNGIEREKPR